jgi:hypothetical protein
LQAFNRKIKSVLRYNRGREKKSMSRKIGQMFSMVCRRKVAVFLIFSHDQSCEAQGNAVSRPFLGIPIFLKLSYDSSHGLV